jgi:hypothetical protein
MVTPTRIAVALAPIALLCSLSLLALDQPTRGLDETIATSSVGEGPATDPTARTTSLTPGRGSLPALAPTAELERAAREIPSDVRVNLPDGTWLLRRIHPLLHPLGSDATPVFTEAGTLVGIAVPGIGVLPREVYDDPSTDFEAVAREKWGAEEYDRMIAVIEEQPQHR